MRGGTAADTALLTTQQQQQQQQQQPAPSAAHLPPLLDFNMLDATLLVPAGRALTLRDLAVTNIR